MPHPSPLACTAIGPPDPPVAPAAAPSATGKRRGNPNLALAPRCGARTRAGCPCRAPAVSFRQRCRMHGGRSTGPRTEAGRARLATARTIHGQYGATQRARDRWILSFVRCGRVFRAALRYRDRLPPDLAARLEQNPPELLEPPYPTAGITAAQDRAMQRAEAAALAPWKQAIVLARQAKRATSLPGGAPPTAASRAASDATAKPHAPIHGRSAQGSAAGPAGSDPANAAQEPHAPERAPIAPATHAALPAATAILPARPHAPERLAGARASRPAAPPAPPKPHAPEPCAALGHPVPGVPAPSPPMVAIPVAKPHAPEQVDGARDNRPAPSPAPATPHAPDRRATIGMAAPAAATAPRPQPAKPHAPDRSPATLEPPRLSGRNLRRWLRRHGSKHQAPAGPRISHPLPQQEGEC